MPGSIPINHRPLVVSSLIGVIHKPRGQLRGRRGLAKWPSRKVTTKRGGVKISKNLTTWFMDDPIGQSDKVQLIGPNLHVVLLRLTTD